MNISKTLFILFISVLPILGLGQQTVGLFENNSESLNGYTLFTSLGSPKSYLIDNCGEKVHEWNSSTGVGNSMYLLDNGLLLRTKNMGNGQFPAGGTGGGIEMLDWESNVIWNYTISNNMECQHHDVSYLPNGNILAIVWERINTTELEQAGREIFGSNFWSEKVVEIEPDLIGGGGTIVWEWRVFDHLIQDYDDSKDNFGIVEEHPELLDINFHPDGGTVVDWLHINSVDYNEEFDQIMLSVNHLSEIWVIDHSTTTEEAASHSGGNYGKGGDFLYRWGNPQSYDAGTNADQKLGRQHDAEWLENDSDEGNILIYNNMQGFGYSSVVEIVPPIDSQGNYLFSGQNYGPEDYFWSYQAPIVSDFYSSFISSSQRLDNGNTFICEGDDGRLFEVKEDGTVVWEYVSPVTGNNILDQEQEPLGNFTFRATKLAIDHPGLAGQDLTPQGFLESGSDINCQLFVSTNEIQEIPLNVYPNPVSRFFRIESYHLGQLIIFNQVGQIVSKKSLVTNNQMIDVSNLSPGIYFLKIIDNQKSIQTGKIIVQ